MSEDAKVAMVLIKPDAILRGLVGQILSRFEQRGFWINSLTTKFKNKEALRELFDGIYDEELDEAVNEYFGRPMIGFLLYGMSLNRLSKIVDTNMCPENAMLGTITEEFGINRINNAVELIYNQDHKFDLFYSNDNDHDPRREDQ